MLEKLGTETRNKNTMQLDEMSPKEILIAMNHEDKTVPVAVENEIDTSKKSLKQSSIHLTTVDD